MTVLSSDHTSLTLLSGVDAGSHSYVVPREAEVFLFSCTSEPQLTETSFSTGISVSLHILLIMKVIKHKPTYTQTKQAKCNKSCTENFCAHINVSTWTESPAQTSHQSSICSVSSISGRLPDGCWLECVCVCYFNKTLTLSTSLLVFPPIVLIWLIRTVSNVLLTDSYNHVDVIISRVKGFFFYLWSDFRSVLLLLLCPFSVFNSPFTPSVSPLLQITLVITDYFLVASVETLCHWHTDA